MKRGTVTGVGRWFGLGDEPAGTAGGLGARLGAVAGLVVGLWVLIDSAVAGDWFIIHVVGGLAVTILVGVVATWIWDRRGTRRRSSD